MTDKEQHDKTLSSIDILVRCLGTMVMIPEYKSNPSDLSAGKQFAGTIQQPILQGVYRETALAKLDEFIKSL